MLLKGLSRLLFLTVLSLFAHNAVTATTVDSASSGGAFSLAPPLTTLSWSHTIGVGLNRAVYVAVSTNTGAVPLPTTRIQSITFGGTPMTAVGAVQASPNSLNAVEMFMLLSPPTGASTIEVTFIPLTVNYAVGGAVSFFHVSQVTPHDTVFGAAGTDDSPTVTVTDSTSTEVVLDALAVTPGAVFAAEGPGQTVRWQGRTFFSNSFDVGAGSTEEATGANTQMSWTLSSADNWALRAVSINSAPLTAAAVSVGGRVLTADGRAIAKARVALTSSDGTVRNAVSNAFGYYRFTDVPSGQTYTVGVVSKTHRFEPRLITLADELVDLDLIAGPDGPN